MPILQRVYQALIFRITFLLLSSFFSVHLSAQTYDFPVNPGRTSLLTGNLSEIRRHHFHAGLDIAVTTGTPVHAAADGYIYRAKISTYGYGKVLYAYHPNTQERTVYAHLNAFNKKISDYLLKAQYEKEDFWVEVFPEPEELPISKGQVIAYTGNTGSSGGPHLHYEIRTPEDIALDPLEFGFREVPQDRLPPLIQGVSLNPIGTQSRINGRFQRSNYGVKRVGPGQYRITEVIKGWGELGLEILSHDVRNGSYFVFGAPFMSLYLDGERIHEQKLNRISHEHNWCMNVHINYPEYQKTSRSYQRAYLADGNLFPEVYTPHSSRGRLLIQDDKVHEVRLVLQDAQKNTTELSLKIQGQSPRPAQFKPSRSLGLAQIKHEIHENVLLIRGQNLRSEGDSAQLYFSGICQKIPINYMEGNQALYLWDLRQGLPDMVEIGNIRYPFRFQMAIPSQTEVFYTEEKLQMLFPDTALFDTLYLETRVEDRYVRINSSQVPLYRPMEVRFFPNIDSTERHYYAAYYNGRNYVRSQWSGDTLRFYPRASLGTFQIIADREAPRIKLLRKSSQGLSFSISDNFSGVGRFYASLNGKFLLMNYEHKLSRLDAIPLEKDLPLQGTFRLEVWDNVGNRQVYETSL